MAYRLKQIRYKFEACYILLQNENGPCPLLAAANCLLLKGSITLPPSCTEAGVVTIDELVNVLAEKILTYNTGTDHHIQEVLTVFPGLQYGMDVNPKFTSGPTGVEYTMHLNAFDLLHIELVHGWLLEPEAEEYELIGDQTYNQLINVVIEGNDASAMLQDDPRVHNHSELSTKATKGSIIHQFLERSGHQLTQYGLTVLHEYLKDGQLMVFFRNNHFNTVTKHEGLLYLLVTDFGYANVSSVVWEKLDVIDGDTEYVTDEFKTPPPMEQDPYGSAATGEQLVANNLQSEADRQLAIQLSRENAAPPGQAVGSQMPQQQDPELEAARLASLGMTATTVTVPNATLAPSSRQTLPSGGVAGGNGAGQDSMAVGIPTQPPTQEQRDRMLAAQLQNEENARPNPSETSNQQQGQQQSPTRTRPNNAMSNSPARNNRMQQQHVSRPGPPPRRLATAPPAGRAGGDNSNCVIS